MKTNGSKTGKQRRSINYHNENHYICEPITIANSSRFDQSTSMKKKKETETNKRATQAEKFV